METAAQKGLALVNFQIDKAVSRFQVQGFATGLLSSFGHNPRIAMRDYEAEIQCLPDTFEKAYLKVTVQTEPDGSAGRNEEGMTRKSWSRRCTKRFWTFSTIRLRSMRAKKSSCRKVADALLNARVNGELSFHGVTQPLTLQANVTRAGNDVADRRGFYAAAIGLRDQAGVLCGGRIAAEGRIEIYI